MRGRKKGTIVEGSVTHTLLKLGLGDRTYIETTLDGYDAKERQWNMPNSRRPDVLKGRVFRTSLFTAVSSRIAGDVRYLICVERVG